MLHTRLCSHWSERRQVPVKGPGSPTQADWTLLKRHHWTDLGPLRKPLLRWLLPFQATHLAPACHKTDCLLTLQVLMLLGCTWGRQHGCLGPVTLPLRRRFPKSTSHSMRVAWTPRIHQHLRHMGAGVHLLKKQQIARLHLTKVLSDKCLIRSQSGIATRHGLQLCAAVGYYLKFPSSFRI